MWKHPEAHPGAYLRERYLEPLGLTPSELADRCGMPRSRVSEILTGKRRITADTAHRLAQLFRMEPEAWMALQAAYDLAQVRLEAPIEPLDPPGFLVSPLGARPIPAARPRLRKQVHTAPLLAAEPEVAYRHEEVRYGDGTRALVAKEIE